MKPEQITDTHQMNFSFETHGFGAAAIAARSISEGKTVSFVCYKRPDKKDSTRLEFVGRHFFGIVEIEEGQKAFRTNRNTGVEDCGSHSLISSWNGNKIVCDPVFIAARLASFLQHEASDYFIEPTN